jgi:hypothetical protein
MSNLPVLSENGERAFRSLGVACADYEAALGNAFEGALESGFGRWESLALAHASRCVIHVEVFVFDRLSQLVEEEVRRISSTMLDSLYKRRRNNLASWPDKEVAAREWLSLEISKCNGWDQLMGYVEMRNAWAHGAGTMTQRQRQDSVRTEKSLSAVNIRVVDGTLYLPEDLVRQCMISLRSYVVACDALLPNA